MLHSNLLNITYSYTHLNTYKNNNKDRSAWQMLREKPSGWDVMQVYLMNNFSNIPLKGRTPVVKIKKIGDLTHIQDFEAIMSRMCCKSMELCE